MCLFCSHKKFSSELSIVTDRTVQNAVPVAEKPTTTTTNISGSAPEATTTKLRLSTHRSDHEIHTPEHRILANHRQVNMKLLVFLSIVKVTMQRFA